MSSYKSLLYKDFSDLTMTDDAQAIAKQLGGVKPDDEWLKAEMGRTSRISNRTK